MLSRKPRALCKAARQFSTQQSFDFVIVGAGAAGLNVASQLASYQKQGILGPDVNVAIIDPSSQHHSQESWKYATVGETSDSPSSHLDTVIGQVNPMGSPVIDADAPTIFNELSGETIFASQDPATFPIPEPEEPTSAPKADEFSKKYLSWLPMGPVIPDEGTVIEMHRIDFLKSLSDKFATPRQPVQPRSLADWTQSTVEAGRKPPTLIEDAVQTFHPEKNQVTTKGGSEITYKQLIVATGESFNLDSIPGLRAGVEAKDSGLMTYADPSHCLTASQYLWALRDGIFLMNRPKHSFQPAEMLPLELLSFFMSLDKDRVIEFYYFNDDDRKDGMFGSIIDDMPHHELVEIRPDSKEAVFNITSGQWTGTQKVQKYDYFLVTPAKEPSPEVKASPLADADGYVDVDMNTFQSTKFPNVFSMGSTSNVPAPKDLYSIKLQSPVMVDNAICAFKGEECAASFDGGQYVGSDRPRFNEGFYSDLIMGEVGEEADSLSASEVAPGNFLTRAYDKYQSIWASLEKPFPNPTIGH